VPLVFFLRLRIDEDVIEVHNAIFIKDASHHFINIGLERRRRVAKAKQHDHIFIIAVSRAERHLPFITLLDPNAVVCISQVQLSKELRVNQAVHQFINTRQRIPIFQRNHVQTSIVNAEA
jgi:hypothetical protein